MIELVRGKMKINVELKYNVPDPGLAPAVIDLLRREKFLDEVVITSLDYAALRQVESIEPRLITGHIVTKAVGDVVRTDADFLSLGSAQATRSLIRRAHAAGKKVHVWTVNKPDAMLRMIERGADNIITDDPALLVRVLHDRNALSKPEILGLGLRVLFSRAPPELVDPGGRRAALIPPLPVAVAVASRGRRPSRRRVSVARSYRPRRPSRRRTDPSGRTDCCDRRAGVRVGDHEAQGNVVVDAPVHVPVELGADVVGGHPERRGMV